MAWTTRGKMSERDLEVTYVMMRESPLLQRLFVTGDVIYSAESTRFMLSSILDYNTLLESPIVVFTMLDKVRTAQMIRFEPEKIWPMYVDGMLEEANKLLKGLEAEGAFGRITSSGRFFEDIFSAYNMFDKYLPPFENNKHEAARNYLNGLTVFQKPNMFNKSLSRFAIESDMKIDRYQEGLVPLTKEQKAIKEEIVSNSSNEQFSIYEMEYLITL